MIDRRDTLLAMLAGSIAGAAAAQTPPPSRAGALLPTDPIETIDLWPKGAPGLPTSAPVETIDERSNDPALPDRAVHGIATPRLVVFRPKVPNGSALMVAPGGGYARVVIDKEGYEIARWLAARGWTVFVLFYRLPGEGWRDRSNVALADAQRAVRLIRAHAERYRIRTDRLAAMGFSAGGHVCADLATRHAETVYAPVDAADRLSARPDLAAPIYPVQSMSLPVAHPGSRGLLIGEDASREREEAHSPAFNITPETPPCFMVHAEDDDVVPVENSLELRAALKTVGIPHELHLFAQGGHGFGLRKVADKPARIWPDLFLNWAQSYGLG